MIHNISKRNILSSGLSILFMAAAYGENLTYSINAETDVQGSLYIGGKLISDQSVAYDKISVDITGGKVATGSNYWKDGTYGGASEFGNENTSFSASEIVINMNGGDVNNLVAGCFATEKGNVLVNSSEINISGGIVRNSVLGGSILTYYTDGTIKGYAQSNMGSAKITISGNAVIGETTSNAKQKSENNDVIFNSVYGGGYTVGSGTQTFGSTNVGISGNAIVNGVVIGGSHAGPTGSAYVGNKDSVDFSNIVSTVSISENADIRGGYVFGGAYHSWGDGVKSSDIYGSTLVSVSGGKIFNSDENAGYIFGGGYSSDGNSATQGSISNVYGNSNVVISGGNVANVFGGMYVNEVFGYGSASGEIKGDTNISITGGNVANVYGGGLTERVSGEASLSITTSVNGNTNIEISDATISGNIYGGGKGSDSVVNGNTNITLLKNAIVNGTVYGGGADNSTVAGNKILNLGNSTVAYTGTLKVADFNIINISSGSSVEFLKYSEDSLNGTSISINNNASLSITVSDILSNTDISNSGALILKRGSLADGTTSSMKSYTGIGTVNVYGGSFSNGVFTAGKSADASTSSGITVGIGSDDVQSVVYSSADSNLQLDFDVSNMGEKEVKLNSITAVSDKGNIDGEFITGFDVVADYDTSVDMSVVFSAYIGDGFDVSKLRAWHKESGGDVWTLFESEIEYKDGIASMVVNGFSSYAFSAVPEPSAYAAIFGLLALGFAIRRRIKQ